MENEDLEKIIQSEFSKNIDKEKSDKSDNTDYRELQIANLALSTMMNPINLNSTSNLSEDEIDDLSDAYYLNSIFQDELIDIKIRTYIELKRSQTTEPKNMLQVISDIVGKTIPQQRENSGLLNRFVGNRFK